MLAFAANSLLCRMALQRTGIDPASFTAVRLAAGATVLAQLVGPRKRAPERAGSWATAFALFGYAAALSFAYVSLPTGTGALLLFGTVQVTMIGRGLWRGERLGLRQQLGLLVALAGLVVLVWPGLATPPLEGAVLMIGAGIAWGVYSLRGAGSADPLRATASNFLCAVPMSPASAALLGGVAAVMSVRTPHRPATDAP